MGNTSSSKSEHPAQEHDARYVPAHTSSPPVAGSPAIGSPLTYVPQVPMVPLASKVADVGRRLTTSNVPEFASATTGSKLMPVVVVWSHGGSSVEVEGSFDNWTTRQPLQHSGKDFTIIKLLAPGVYQYKFIVDGEWKYDPNQPAMFDEMGNVNNVLEVHEYVPENLDGISGFDPPPSPTASYNNPEPAAEDYAKEPPIMPPHLQLTLLNVPPAADAQAVLPRPQHVILNHLYLRKGQSVNALVVGTTHRYKAKYITTVMYRPNMRRGTNADPEDEQKGLQIASQS